MGAATHAEVLFAGMGNRKSIQNCSGLGMYFGFSHGLREAQAFRCCPAVIWSLSLSSAQLSTARPWCKLREGMLPISIGPVWGSGHLKFSAFCSVVGSPCASASFLLVHPFVQLLCASLLSDCREGLLGCSRPALIPGLGFCARTPACSTVMLLL